MNTLFKDSEVFVKERPISLSPKQKKELMLKLAKEVKENNWSTSSIERIADDLCDLRIQFDGYDTARELDDFGKNASYNINLSFAEWLDCLNSEINDVVIGFQKEWVNAHYIKPKFKIGQELIINENINEYLTDLEKGCTIFINSINKSTARYMVSNKKGDTRNTVLNFEDVEDKCSVVESKS